MPNNCIHSDKINLRRFAVQLYFASDAGRYAQEGIADDKSTQ